MPFTGNNLSIVRIFVPLMVACVIVFSRDFVNADWSYSVKTKNIQCTFDPLWVENVTCKLKPVSWDKSVATVGCNLLQPLRNTSLRIELYKYTNQFRPFLINVTVNICKWLNTRDRQNTYASLFLNMMTRFSNLNHSCPFQGYVGADGMFFDPKMAHFIIPSGRYKFAFTFFEGLPPPADHNVLLGSFTAEGLVNEDENVGPSSRDKLFK